MIRYDARRQGSGLKVSEVSIALFSNPPQQLGMSELWNFEVLDYSVMSDAVVFFSIPRVGLSFR